MTLAEAPAYTVNRVMSVDEPSMGALMSVMGDPTRDLSVTFSTAAEDARYRLLVEVVDRLNALLRLPTDWDHDGASAIDPATARAAMDFLVGVIERDTVVPQAFPVPSGGVQLEWLIGGKGLEIEFNPDGRAYVLGTAADGTVELEQDAVDRQGVDLQVAARMYLRAMSAPLSAR